jgi:hypothetical protein
MLHCLHIKKCNVFEKFEPCIVLKEVDSYGSIYYTKLQIMGQLNFPTRYEGFLPRGAGISCLPKPHCLKYSVKIKGGNPEYLGLEVLTLFTSALDSIQKQEGGGHWK